jgi:copper(I)-binding protein
VVNPTASAAPAGHKTPLMPWWLTPGRGRLLLVLALVLPCLAAAHGARAGDVLIDHPYATPSEPGARTAAVYFRALKNTGATADRLLGAHTAAARAVQIQRASAETGQTRLRALPLLEVPAGATLSLRHGGDTQLTLVDLSAPLKDGDRFLLTLRFELGGEREVSVWVQQPRDRNPPHAP